MIRDLSSQRWQLLFVQGNPVRVSGNRNPEKKNYLQYKQEYNNNLKKLLQNILYLIFIEDIKYNKH